MEFSIDEVKKIYAALKDTVHPEIKNRIQKQLRAWRAEQEQKMRKWCGFNSNELSELKYLLDDAGSSQTLDEVEDEIHRRNQSGALTKDAIVWLNFSEEDLMLFKAVFEKVGYNTKHIVAALEWIKSLS